MMMMKKNKDFGGEKKNVYLHVHMNVYLLVQCTEITFPVHIVAVSKITDTN